MGHGQTSPLEPGRHSLLQSKSHARERENVGKCPNGSAAGGHRKALRAVLWATLRERCGGTLSEPASSEGRGPHHDRAGGQRRAQQGEPPSIHGGPELQAPTDRAVIKRAVRAPVSRERFPEVMGPVGSRSLVGLLSLIADSGEVPIEHSRHQLVAHDRLYGRHAHVHFAMIMMSGPVDGLGRHFGRKDGGHGLRRTGQRLDPTELRRVERETRATERPFPISAYSSIDGMEPRSRVTLRPRSTHDALLSKPYSS